MEAIEFRQATPGEVAELRELCRSIVEDGTVSESEAALLANWIRSHPEIRTDPAVADIYGAVTEALWNDGRIDSFEREDLYEVLKAETGLDGRTRPG